MTNFKIAQAKILNSVIMVNVARAQYKFTCKYGCLVTTAKGKPKAETCSTVTTKTVLFVPA